MSLHRFTVDVEIDDDAIADHDGEAAPPPNDPAEWDARDLFLAADRGFFDAGIDVELIEYEPVQHARTLDKQEPDGYCKACDVPTKDEGVTA